jgi:hypothetical protein
LLLLQFTPPLCPHMLTSLRGLVYTIWIKRIHRWLTSGHVETSAELRGQRPRPPPRKKKTVSGDCPIHSQSADDPPSFGGPFHTLCGISRAKSNISFWDEHTHKKKFHCILCHFSHWSCALDIFCNKKRTFYHRLTDL